MLHFGQFYMYFYEVCELLLTKNRCSLLVIIMFASTAEENYFLPNETNFYLFLFVLLHVRKFEDKVVNRAHHGVHESSSFACAWNKIETFRQISNDGQALR